MAECVYCGKNTSLTREHIFPSFVYKYQESMKQGKTLEWIEKAQKLVPGEAVIKDVCDTCNNDILGSLDGMAKTLLEKLGIFTQNFEKNKLTINYEYNQISRWLLKVAYNSSRASGKQKDIFEKFKNYIISGSEPPSNFIISAGLMKPLKLSESQKIQFGEILHANRAGYVNPFFTRISWAPCLNSDFSLKQIVIGGLVFHIVIFNESVTRPHRKQLTKEYLKMCVGMNQIRKNKKILELVQIPLTHIDSMQHHMLRPEVEPHLQKLLINH